MKLKRERWKWRNRAKAIQNMRDMGYALTIDGKLVHREVCKLHHGRFPRQWVVHHIDFNIENNSPENLIALPRKLHDHIHSAMKKNNVRFDRKTIEGYLKPYKNPYKPVKLKEDKKLLDKNFMPVD